jgi:hypothetical protein
MLGFFTTKIVAIGSGIIIALLLAWGGLQYVKLQKAQADKVTAIADRDKVAIERDKAIGVANTNADTISKLNQEKKDIEDSVARLAAQRKKDQATISNLSSIIDSQDLNPENHLILSPVLKEIITNIQDQRVKRWSTVK